MLLSSYWFNVYYTSDYFKNSMSAVLYNEKCDKCGKTRPEFFVQVNKTNTSSGGVVWWLRHSFGVWNVLGGNHSKVTSE